MIKFKHNRQCLLSSKIECIGCTCHIICIPVNVLTSYCSSFIRALYITCIIVKLVTDICMQKLMFTCCILVNKVIDEWSSIGKKVQHRLQDFPFQQYRTTLWQVRRRISDNRIAFCVYVVQPMKKFISHVFQNFYQLLMHRLTFSYSFYISPDVHIKTGHSLKLANDP